MSNSILTILFVAFAGIVFGQLPNKVKGLEGVWEYKNGSGFETWKLNGDVLEGESYRYTRLRDSIHVEDMSIRMVNKVLVHSIEQYSVDADSSEVSMKKMVFIGGKRKMKFVNSEAQVPYSITYKIGCLNRKKLRVFIQYGAESKNTKIVLEKIKS